MSRASDREVPQLAGGGAFLTVASGSGPAPPSLLVSRDLGRSWQRLVLSSGAGAYPQVTFFGAGAGAGVLVAAGSQQKLGRVLYTTVNSGQSWTPVRQGRQFTALGATVDFAGPGAGFAWTQGSDAAGSSPPPVYATVNSGRSWHIVIPRLSS